MSHVISDLRFTMRSWRRSPGLTAAAVLAIALGVAATTTMFSFVSGVLLEPLPYPYPERVVVVWQDFSAIDGRKREWTAPGLFLEWQRRSADAFSALAAIGGWAPVLVGDGEPERLTGALVTAGYFNVLGARAALGRLLTKDDDVAGAPTVAVISHGLWVRRFGSDPSIVGRQLRLDSGPATIVGVAEAGLVPAILDAEIWAAMRIPAGAPTAMVTLRAIARLREDVPLRLAQDRMSAMARRLEQEQISEERAGIFLEPLRDEITGPVRTPLIVLMSAVGIVLLIACANVALLLLARAAERRREMSLRAAIGAPRGRLLAQLLTEALALAVLGSVIGLALAFASLESVRGLAPPTVPRLADVGVDLRVLLFSGALIVVTTLIVGVVPAIAATRVDLIAVLRDTGTDMTPARSHPWLVCAEVALAVALLSAAGQMLRSFDNLQRVDLGFVPRGLVATTIGLPRPRYPTDQHVRQFYDRVFERLASSPDVRDAALVSVLPLSGADTDLSFQIAGRPLPTSRAEAPTAWFRIVSDGYFRTMGIKVLEGRTFAATDTDTTPCAVVVNRTLAQRYWAGSSPVGARLLGMGRECHITSVVGDVHHRGPGVPTEPEMYFSMRQRALRGPAVSIVLRTATTPQAAADTLRAIVRAEDPMLPPGTARTLEDLLERTLAQPRFTSKLLTAFAATALILAIIGVYGLLSHSVASRTRELGIRTAVGAGSRDIARLVGRMSVITVLGGAVAGLAASFVLSRGLRGMLYDVEPGDPVTSAAVFVLVATAGLAATIAPARRAIRIDPLAALRTD